MFDTVIGHVDAGSIQIRKRKTADDLEFAATWLEQYEGDVEDDRANLVALASVAAWLRSMAEKR